MSLSPDQFAESFRRFLDVVNDTATESGFGRRLSAHLGRDAGTVPVLTEEFASYEHPTLQRALEAVLAAPGRRHERIGLAGANKRFMSPSFSDLLSGHLREGPVDWVNVHLAGGEVLPCVQSGLFLISTDQSRYAVFVAGASDAGPGTSPRVEVAAAEEADATALLAELRTLMERLDVYRGHVLSLRTGQMFGPRGPNTELIFHDRTQVRRDEVVLPDGLLARIERHTLTFSEHAQLLLAAGRSLRRGVLLHGPPGVGKTLTVRYLCSHLSDRTVLLLTGPALGALAAVSTLARRLAPSMVVLEDVDLIAEERTMPFRGAPSGLLFELLNEMDGLREDADVIYLLTTNRAELLEPALALRPGRIDLTVELPLPDAEGRHRLFELYARGVEVALDWEPYVEQTAGASPAYIKELLRQAVLRAAEAGRGSQIIAADLDGALGDLAAGGELARRLLGAAAEGGPARRTVQVGSAAPPGAGSGPSAFIQTRSYFAPRTRENGEPDQAGREHRGDAGGR